MGAFCHIFFSQYTVGLFFLKDSFYKDTYTFMSGQQKKLLNISTVIAQGESKKYYICIQKFEINGMSY